MADLIGLYRNDLPNLDIVYQDLLLWKNKWPLISVESRPSTLAESVKKCNEKEIPKYVYALEDRVHIASNILRVRENFFSNKEITKKK